MAIADLIARAGGRIDVPDFAQAAIEGAQAGRLAGAQRLNAQDVAQQVQARTLANLATKQAQDDAQLQRTAMQDSTTMGEGGPSLDQSGYLLRLVQGGAAPVAYQEQSRLKAAQIAEKQAKIDEAQKEIARRTQVLSGIKSPMQLAAALPEMERQGINVDALRAVPFQRNWKETIDGLIDQGLTHKERLDQAKQTLDEQASALQWNRADWEQQYQRTNQTETGRHNRATESVDWYRAQNPASTMAPGGGKPPPGYRFTPNGDLEAIPGGPADAKKIALDEKARTGAQRVGDFANGALTTIDQLIASPGLAAITGKRSLLPTIPGTDASKAEALAEQIEGQSFLQAFQSLKGAGAITETEGKKATAAIARLKRTQRKEDYVQALNELRGIVEETKRRASEKSGPATRFYQGQEYVQTPAGTWEAK